MLILLLVLLALICFGIPAIKAILAQSFDYTDSGLALYMLYIIFTGVMR
jgi:hypothetical protein